MATFNVNMQLLNDETIDLCDSLKREIDKCLSSIKEISVPFTFDAKINTEQELTKAQNLTVEYKNSLLFGVESVSNANLKLFREASSIEIEKF